MRPFWQDFPHWQEKHPECALAYLVANSGSGPRRIGSALAVDKEKSNTLGSVSAGCIESEVIEAAVHSIKTGAPQTLSFGTTDDPVFQPSLPCGGKILVRVCPWPGTFSEKENRLWNRAMTENSPVILREYKGTIRCLPWEPTDWHPSIELPGERARIAAIKADTSAPSLFSPQPDNHSNSVFYLLIRPCHRMIIVGGNDVAASLVPLCHQLEFETMVIDPRDHYLQPNRFPQSPDKCVRSWPIEPIKALENDIPSFGIVLSHEPRIDDPALIAMLQHPAFVYIGAMGSASTHQRRLQRLAEQGIPCTSRNRIMAPVGSIPHCRTPEQIALSIAAQILEIQLNGHHSL